LHFQVTVWCGFTSEFVIGPYFFQEVNENGELVSVTVNGGRYLDMLQNFVIPELIQRNQLQQITFMQDGAPPHFTNPVREYLEQQFGEERIISRGFTNAWPARSPDLTPVDFWFWSYVKSLVYQRPPANFDQLRQAITAAVHSITPDQLRNAVYHTVDRMQILIDENGNHIEQLLI